jgi:hypothetical protein
MKRALSLNPKLEKAGQAAGYPFSLLTINSKAGKSDNYALKMSIDRSIGSRDCS